MNTYRIHYTLEHGAEYDCVLQARTYREVMELFREDFGSRVHVDYCDLIEEDDGVDYDDSMDGDEASALASVGWGTDEDYGGFDERF